MRISTAVVLAGVVATISQGAPAKAALTTISLGSPLTSFTDDLGTAFSVTATQPTGSGIFSPIDRIERMGNAQGYNSSLNNGPNATMDLVNLPGNASPTLVMNNVVTPDNTVLLTLDYNEQGKAGKSLLNLDELVLVVSTDPDKTGPGGPANNGTWTPQSIPMSAGDLVVYQMSSATYAGNNFTVQLNADNNPANGNGGSGTADLNVMVNLSGVPNVASLVDANHYLYVYSRFSNAGAGYGEWSALQQQMIPSAGSGVPEPASLGVLGVAALGLLVRRRR